MQNNPQKNDPGRINVTTSTNPSSINKEEMGLKLTQQIGATKQQLIDSL